MSSIEFIRGFAHLAPQHRECVATIGAFDGVHLGHQVLLRALIQQARERQLPSLVVVFEPQPNEYFHTLRAPARLMRLREKVRAFHEAGIDRVLCLKFDATLRSYTAKAFVERILLDGLAVKYLVVGDDFRFGCDRSGDYSFLQQAGIDHGFTVEDTKTYSLDEDRISSTRIRQYLSDGDLDAANACLGRAYANSGRVIYGQQLGRTLGFPTLNIGLGRLAVPLSGVYIVEVTWAKKVYRGVANVGVRPTVSGRKKPILEVHLLDVTIDLYGECVEVRYLAKLRSEKKFSDVDALTQQIASDVATARAFFSS